MFGELVLVLISSSLISGSFINPYPRFKSHNAKDNEAGDPLFLTPLLEAGKLSIHDIQDMAAVNLPELQEFPGYSGYFTVNKTTNSNLFFWHFKAALNPETAPVILWLQGGPGASSLFGLFTENGPFLVTKTGKVKKRKYSWQTNHNMIYIDNPTGTGFSFTDKDEGYARNEVDVGRDLHEALKQFFTLFPDLVNNDFYLSGESYAGK